MTYTTMADTIGPCAKNIPKIFQKVAGYVTGGNGIAWTHDEWVEFANVGNVRICQNAQGDPFQADVFDIEPGALTIAQFVSMASRREVEKKWNSCAYIDAVHLGDLVQACDNAKLTMVELWVANWNLDVEKAVALLGTKVRNYEIVSVQWASPTSNPNTVCPGSTKTLKELNIDLSVTQVGWFPAPHLTTPAPAPPIAPPVTMSHTGTLTLPVDTKGHSYTLNIISNDGKSWTLA